MTKIESDKYQADKEDESILQSKIELIMNRQQPPQETFWSKMISYFNCGNYNSYQNKQEVALNGELKPEPSFRNKTIKKYHDKYQTSSEQETQSQFVPHYNSDDHYQILKNN